jgi:hypothetical protein
LSEHRLWSSQPGWGNVVCTSKPPADPRPAAPHAPARCSASPSAADPPAKPDRSPPATPTARTHGDLGTDHRRRSRAPAGRRREAPAGAAPAPLAARRRPFPCPARVLTAPHTCPGHGPPLPPAPGARGTRGMPRPQKGFDRPAQRDGGLCPRGALPTRVRTCRAVASPVHTEVLTDANHWGAWGLFGARHPSPRSHL